MCINKFKWDVNCCDGIYNSFDVHFTSACDNRCRHCIDMKYQGKGIIKPDPKAIARTIIDHSNGFDDVLFLGGEPCLYLDELYDCICRIKAATNLKCFVTTSVPKTCYTNYSVFLRILEILDGMNLSVQHYREDVADEIRCVKSTFDRQKFYSELPMKGKMRINLNIVKPYLYKREDLLACLKHYDDMGYREIKLSEIQHGTEHFVSFEKTLGMKMKSPFAYGCQQWVDMRPYIPEYKGRLLLKRSCFLCEETLKASFMDGMKVIRKYLLRPQKGHYAVVYEDGSLANGWV